MTIEEARAKIQGYYDRKIRYLDAQYELRSSLGMRYSEINLGHYTTDKGSIELWRWRVLDVMGNALLLLSETVLTDVGIHEPGPGDPKSGVTWENCTARRYLNSDFIKKHFHEDAAAFILPAKIITVDNNEEALTSQPFAHVRCQGKGCGETTDRIFLLSIDECRKYAYTGDGTCGGFNSLDWLRSPGIGYDHFAYYKRGRVYPEGKRYFDDEAEGQLRPAMFYDINGLKDLG